ncbi:hypothetical protein [Bradyrhizobium sp. 150]|uniref:hypothetical protein n=1 Tax=Bradyrhizobium sp. 150 TaxID=2782625 RepID=UPI001FF97840|nr:hypothetical protein [Bradyrhizobium sp. 150]MCK1670305.1 hypothetical protein [Bradyrhizobium sp. 150]
MLSISDANINDDRLLLTTAELRAAAGLTVGDTSQDATLIPLGSYVSAAITSACKVVRAGAIPPTLRLETVTETFLFRNLQKSLVLARRPVVEIISVTETDSLLSTDDYQTDKAAGIIYRTNGTGMYLEGVGPWSWWATGSTVVIYSAGYDEVPADLKYAAIKFIQAELAQGTRDPLLKRLRIDGISEREWWVNPERTSVVPGEVIDILAAGGYTSGPAFA